MTKVLEGKFDAKGKSFAIVVSRWNEFIVGKLLEGAKDSLLRHNCDIKNITVIYCPGSFELPLIVQKAALTKKYDAIIALGAVIRGATPHFEFVAGESIKGIAQVALSSGVPCINGILTCDTIEQAIERAGTKVGNKGFEAATVAIEMVDVLSQIK
jgi:6,7-dimethyl-8-ribityllumazine synthase